MTPGQPLRSDDPDQLGEYRLLRRLGHGGMGVVYLGENASEVKVALKVIHPHLASHDEFRERFRSEVELARKVARFSTAPILDSDTDANPPYIVTEFIDGPTVSAVVAQHGPLSGSQLHALGVGMASALTAIHGAGIVHRDLKPANVLLSRFGPRVIDFGIARAADAVSGFTRTGQYIGSPSYMAPEQFRGEPITPAADIFAWGAVMAFAGTGRQPFGKSAEAVLYRVVYGDADLDGLDPQLVDLVRRALSKHPHERPSAQHLLDLLVHAESGGGRPVSGMPGPVSGPPVSSPPGSDLPVSGAPAAAHVSAPPGPVSPGAPQTPTSSPPRPVPPGMAPGQFPQPGPAPTMPPLAGPMFATSTPPPRAYQPNSSIPPFGGPTAAPPRPRPRPRSGRTVAWTAIIVLLVICLGCVGSVGGVAYFGMSLDRDDALTALGDYFENVQRQRYTESYERLCPEAKKRTTLEAYLGSHAGEGRLTSYTVDKESADYDLDLNGFRVKVKLSYAGGHQVSETYEVIDDPADTTKYHICPP